MHISIYFNLTFMVEARGVEPLSENLSIWLSTSVARYLHSLAQPLAGRLLRLVAPNAIADPERLLQSFTTR